MQNISYTVAKIDREMWLKIKKGEKRIEVRDEPFENDYVLFIDSQTGEALGLVYICETMLLRYEDRNMRIIAEFARCPVSKLKDYLNIKEYGGTYICLSYVDPLVVSSGTLQALAVSARCLGELNHLEEVHDAQ